jgi:hypothetical protein
LDKAASSPRHNAIALTAFAGSFCMGSRNRFRARLWQMPALRHSPKAQTANCLGRLGFRQFSGNFFCRPIWIFRFGAKLFAPAACFRIFCRAASLSLFFRFFSFRIHESLRCSRFSFYCRCLRDMFFWHSLLATPFVEAADFLPQANSDCVCLLRFSLCGAGFQPAQAQSACLFCAAFAAL